MERIWNGNREAIYVLEVLLGYSCVSEYWRLSTSNRSGDHEYIEEMI